MSDRKLKMSAFFVFEIKRAKTDKIFHFLKGCFSVMSGPMDMVFDMFSKINMRLLKYVTYRVITY